MLAFDIKRDGRRWYVVDNTGLRWSRGLPSASTARGALAQLRDVAHR